MQNPSIPLVKDVVFVGGGHTHALVLRDFGMRPLTGLRLTVINPGPTAPYSGMLPGHVAGHYSRDALEIDLVRLARFARARLILGAAEHIDAAAQIVRVPGRPPIHYDLLSVDIGITSRMDALPGFPEHATPAKPLAVFADRWEAFCTDPGPARVAVIGGGVAGVELALACAHRLESLGRAPEVSVIDRGEILAKCAPSARKRLVAALQAKGITQVPNAPIARIEPKSIVLTSDTQIEADFIIGAAGAVPHPWLADCGFAHQGGYMDVDGHLRSASHPNVYGAGDCVHLTENPRPKAGVYAVRAAPILSHNLRAAAQGKSPKRFVPQKDFLKLISLGGKSALAEKAGITLAGPGMWRWKNQIDQKFMDQFRHLPEMPAQPLPEAVAAGVAEELDGPAPCGGCGAKLGSDALSPVFAAPPTSQRDDIETGIGDDAAVLRFGQTRQVISTDHLRGFADDPVLVTRAAALHALGDVWAMGARPQAALAQVILPHMAAPLQSRWMEEIMATARAVFAEEGAAIVGGHSSMGSELTIGFTVTGVMDAPAITLSGAMAGDALILSHGLGTGTILAAEMQGKAPGEVVANAWSQMARSQGEAARLLANAAHAMTDVTGFGLAGHLAEICRASGLGAHLDLSAVPVIDGAEALAEQGIRSSLWAQNKLALTDQIDVDDSPRAALLFDPQTCGGLLAAVPADKANALVVQLRALGHDAVKIGNMREGAPRIETVA